MDREVRRIVENRKGRQKCRVIESNKKEEITCTEFLEGGNTIYTNKKNNKKTNTGHPNGDSILISNAIYKTNN